MANATKTLSIGLTFRRETEIDEVQSLLAEIENKGYTRSDIFLIGLREIVKLTNK